jgi:hypothetical protein
MTPYTCQGYVLQGTLGGDAGQPSIRYGAGYISDIKPWTSDNFISMSRAAGAAVDRGVATAGALFSFANFSLGAIDYYSSDIINIGYAEAKYVTRLPEQLDVMLSAQYVNQRSVGDDLLIGSSFSANLVGLRSEFGRNGAILTLAYTAAGTGADLKRPWSGNPVYTGSLLRGFDRASEQATLIKLSYDFSELGLTGISAYAHYSHGWIRGNDIGLPSLSERELDLSLQWRPDWQVLKGFWFRGIYCLADTNQAGARTRLRDLRLIANYTFLLF